MIIFGHTCPKIFTLKLAIALELERFHNPRGVATLEHTINANDVVRVCLTEIAVFCVIYIHSHQIDLHVALQLLLNAYKLSICCWFLAFSLVYLQRSTSTQFDFTKYLKFSFEKLSAEVKSSKVTQQREKILSFYCRLGLFILKMPKCAAFNCPNTTGRNRKEGVSFHR